MVNSVHIIGKIGRQVLKFPVYYNLQSFHSILVKPIFRLLKKLLGSSSPSGVYAMNVVLRFPGKLCLWYFSPTSFASVLKFN